MKRLEHIIASPGLKIEYSYQDTLKEAWEAMRAGKADIIAGVYLDERLCSEYGIRSTIQYNEEISFAVARSGDGIYESDALTVAVQKSFVGLQEYLRTSYPQWTVVGRTSPSWGPWRCRPRRCC